MAGEHLDKAFRELAERGEAGESGENTTMLTRTDAPSLRLVRCSTCKVLEEIPDYTGDPHYDMVLDDVVRRHEEIHGDRDTLVLLRVSQEDWGNPGRKRQIHKSIWEGVKGFVPEYYATKSTYQEDAVKCFKAHSFSVPCIDWRSDRKRLGNPTKEGWKQAVVVLHLCDFCPVKVKVQEAQMLKLGKMEA